MAITTSQAEANYKTRQEKIVKEIEDSIDHDLKSNFMRQKKINIVINVSDADRQTLDVVVDHYLKAGWKSVEIKEEVSGRYGWVEMEYGPGYEKDENKPEHDNPENWIYRR